MATHTFQLPHRSSRTQRRSLSRDRKRKRKASKADDDEVADIVQDDDSDSKPQSQSQSAIAGLTSLTANKAEQYRTAGLDPYEDVPPHPFPHAPLDWIRPQKGPRKDPEAEEGRDEPQAHMITSLRQRHLRNLTSVMHRCLLDGDYERAGKAWSLLIRSNPPIDIRRHDQWGIGAELLMRRTNSTHHDEEADGDSDDDSDYARPETPFIPNTSYCEEGLKSARSYYAMLIRRFPGQVAARNVDRSLPNATDFNPALLNIWLYQVAFTRKKVIKELEEKLDHDEAFGQYLDADRREAERNHKMERLRISELREAESILARLDDLFRSPAYDRDEGLRHLYDKVKMWIKDLDAGGGSISSNDADGSVSRNLAADDIVTNASVTGVERG